MSLRSAILLKSVCSMCIIYKYSVVNSLKLIQRNTVKRLVQYNYNINKIPVKNIKVFEKLYVTLN